VDVINASVSASYCLSHQALTKLDDYGFIQSRPKGEYHANNQVGLWGWWLGGWVGDGMGVLLDGRGKDYGKHDFEKEGASTGWLVKA
jgi:hypothetical protein